MNATDVIALQPGQPLDQAVHALIFNNSGPVQPYSTEDGAGMAILDRVPMFVGRVGLQHPKLDLNRPWVAGTLSFDPNFKGDITSLRVTAATRLVALCKAALIFTLSPAAGPAPRAAASQPRSNPASQQAAKDIARRVGTKRARSPKAAPQEAPARAATHRQRRRQTCLQQPSATLRVQVRIRFAADAETSGQMGWTDSVCRLRAARCQRHDLG